MFIDIDYFKGALQIPNLDKDEQAFISNYIEPYEQEVLTHLLGNTLYQELISGYNTNNNDKWKWLVEGKDFIVTISDIDYTVKWNGLINSNNISLIAYYIYFHYVQQNYQQLTGLGVQQQISENSQIVSPNQKLVWAWNKCRSLSGLYERPTTGIDITYLSVEPTLFNFIVNNISDYTGFIYNPIKEINVLGI